MPFSHHLLLPSERRDPDTTLDAQGKQADATMQEIQQKYQTFKLLESTLLQKRYVLPHTFPSRAPGGA